MFVLVRISTTSNLKFIYNKSKISWLFMIYKEFVVYIFMNIKSNEPFYPRVPCYLESSKPEKSVNCGICHFCCLSLKAPTVFL